MSEQTENFAKGLTENGGQKRKAAWVNVTSLVAYCFNVSRKEAKRLIRAGAITLWREEKSGDGRDAEVQEV